MDSVDFSYWVLGLAAALLALAFWAQRRSVAAHKRAERVRKFVEEEDLGGHSYFMPLPKLEEAVEVERTVEIDSLLSGESSTVAAEARRQLEAPTDVLGAPDTGGLVPPPGVLPLRVAPLPSVPGAPAGPAAAADAQSAVPMAPLPRSPSAPATAPAAARRAPASAEATAARYSPDPSMSWIYPVRELVIAWFEARGYRAEDAPESFAPIESILRHREDTRRVYAFVSVSEPLASGKALTLIAKAQSQGIRRMLVAVQAKSAPMLDERLASMGLRQYDEKTIRAEIERLDLRVAAKIIAVAQKRAGVRIARASVAG
jgi:hypothetical protein